jgi:hypothetical protein
MAFLRDLKERQEADPKAVAAIVIIENLPLKFGAFI